MKLTENPFLIVADLYRYWVTARKKKWKECIFFSCGGRLGIMTHLRKGE